MGNNLKVGQHGSGVKHRQLFRSIRTEKSTVCGLSRDGYCIVVLKYSLNQFAHGVLLGRKALEGVIQLSMALNLDVPSFAKVTPDLLHVIWNNGSATGFNTYFTNTSRQKYMVRLICDS